MIQSLLQEYADLVIAVAMTVRVAVHACGPRMDGAKSWRSRQPSSTVPFICEEQTMVLIDSAGHPQRPAVAALHATKTMAVSFYWSSMT